MVSPRAEERFRAHFQGFPPEQAARFAGRSWAMAEAERLEDLSARICYVTQEQPEGYGHAVHCAREFVGEDPFLLLLGDHIFISGARKPCSRQVLDAHAAYDAPISGVQRTGEELLHLFGTLTGRPISANPNVYEVSEIKEKPDPEYAEEHLRTPGLRRGEYLCFFGMHVLPPAIFEMIEHHIRHNLRERGEIQLTNALEMLRAHTRYLAAEVDGDRLDMGVPLGYVQTQLALALNSPARHRVLAALPGLLTHSDLEIGRAHV